MYEYITRRPSSNNSKVTVIKHKIKNLVLQRRRVLVYFLITFTSLNKIRTFLSETFLQGVRYETWR
jgi:hypothetical protein